MWVELASGAVCRVAEKQRLRQQDREEACAEQREIEKEVVRLRSLCALTLMS